MAEIKSTLDLIMEKTQHMTLSEEEKHSLRTQELERKARGLVQQYCAKRIPLKDVRTEFDTAGNSRKTLSELLIRAIVDVIDPDSDNAGAFTLLSEILELDPAPYAAALAVWRSRRDEYLDAASATCRADLSAAGISGTAVVPNLAAGDTLNTLCDGLREDFRHAAALIADI